MSTVEVPMSKIRRGFWCFHHALTAGFGSGTARLWLGRYLNYCPLPRLLGNGDPSWDQLTEAAAHKLEALQEQYGHGDTVAKAFILRWEAEKEVSGDA